MIMKQTHTIVIWGQYEEEKLGLWFKSTTNMIWCKINNLAFSNIKTFGMYVKHFVMLIRVQR